MKFISFEKDNTQSWGVLTEDNSVIDLGSIMGADLKTAIANKQINDALDLAKKTAPSATLDDVKLLSPIPNPRMIACIGVNYANRNAEYKDGSEAPKFPSLFMRVPESFTTHKEPLWRPPESDMLDYEGEIVVVIGKGGRRIKEENAYEHIAGLTVMNEGTLRDWVRHAKFNVTQGKNFDGSGSMGPFLVPFKDPAQIVDIGLQTRVNGELRQDDRTSRMLFPIAYQIAYISTFTTLVPGDIIITGTPTGAGARLDPPQYLKPGDVIEVEGEGIGVLRNTVEDET